MVDGGSAQAALSAAEATDPTVARFLQQYPDLREPAARTLACAAAVRAARAAALPACDRRVLANPGSEFVQAERDFLDAVGTLERLASRDTPPRSNVLAAVERLVRAAVSMRVHSHRFSPRRATSSPAARVALLQALPAFRQAYAELVALAGARHAGSIPWQIELATHVEPGTPIASMAIDGYDLPQTPAAQKPWGERCFLSGTQFIEDSHLDPALRYRSLDSCHVVAPRFCRALERLQSACRSLRDGCPEAVERLARVFPVFFEDYVAERWHPTFGKLGLLDFPALAVSLNNMFRSYADRPFLGVRESEGWWPHLGVDDRCAVALRDTASGYSWQTYDEIRARSLRLAFAFEQLGLAPGDRVGIISTQNGPEFWLADLAAIFSELITVGLQDTLPDEELLTITADAELTALVCDGVSFRRFRAAGYFAALPGLRSVVVFDSDDVDAGKGTEALRVVELRELLSEDIEIPDDWVSASGVGLSTEILYGDQAGLRLADARGIGQDSDDDVYTILFTSGSTGSPKGTIVTRRRWAEEMCLDANVWPHVRVSYQPPALAVDRVLVWRTLYSGGRVGFARRGASLFRDIRAIRPTVFDAPPVLWNTIYSEYKQAVGDPELSAREVLQIQRRFKHSLGGRLALVATGGAASDPGVRRAMEAIFDVHMVDNYGTTETGRIAVDGRLLPGLDYRLLAVPELGFTPDDRPYPRGELAVRTARATSRYLERSESAGADFTEDGYFRTGDIVEIGPEDRCSLIGRRKGFFKLAAGEFVSPELLEKHYLTSESVEAVFVTGSPLRHEVVAVVVPSADGGSKEQLLNELRRIGRSAGLRPTELPAAVIIETRSDGGMPWTVENGLLTPSLKLNRRALEARYRERIESAYQQAESRPPTDPVGDPNVSGGLDATASRLARIAAALVAVPLESIDLQRSFLDHGGDSITSIELTLRLEQVFSGKGEKGGLGGVDPRWLVEAPLEEVAHWLVRRGGPAEPVRDPSRTATRQLVERARPTPTRSAGAASVDSLSLANRDACTLSLPETLPPPSRQSHVFLTGATGFLGAQLVHHLATTLPRPTKIYALVRAKNDQAASQRLQGALRQAQLAGGAIAKAANGARIIPLAGSLEHPRLGLSDDTYDRLSEEIGLIYHVAALVSFDADYAELRAANVEGTRRVLELATASTLKALHFVSTLNVAMLIERSTGSLCKEDSPLPEELTESVFGASLGYTVSKWVSERMIHRLFSHCQGAWRASVCRPALITWSQETGVADQTNWLTRVLTSSLLLRCAIGEDEIGVPAWIPESSVSARGLDMVPVDFVARAVSRLGELTRTSGLAATPRSAGDRLPTFHVSNLSPGESGLVTVPHLMDMLVAADLSQNGVARPMLSVPFSEWASRAEMESAPAVPVLDQLKRMLLLRRTRAECFAAAMAAPGRATIGCPPFDQSMVEAFVRRWHRDRGRD